MRDFLSEAERLFPWMAAIREDLHAHPEKGNGEVRTTETIARVLEEMGIRVERPLPTGLVGVLHGGKPGRTVAFRADIDALPVQEETGLPFASVVPGWMHACGHDMHAAGLLGAMKLLGGQRDELSGNIVCIFQPDEEGDGGAKRILDSGILDRLGVQAVYGSHVEPSLPTGTIGLKSGGFYANAVTFDLLVHGKGGHAAEPEKGTDALYACALLCTRLKELTKREGGERSVCTVGSFHAGTVRNVIPSVAQAQGILRCTSLSLRERRKGEIRSLCQGVEAETGTQVELHLHDGYPGVENDPLETRFVEKVASDLLGGKHVVREPEGTMTTEDFGYFLQRYPGCFYHVGVSCPYPLHSSRMAPDEKALVTAAAVDAAVLSEAARITR